MAANITSGVNNSNDDPRPRERLLAEEMIEMVPTGNSDHDEVVEEVPTGNSDHDEVVEEDLPSQEIKKLIAGKEIVCVFLVSLLVLSVIAFSSLAMILYLPREDASSEATYTNRSFTFLNSTGYLGGHCYAAFYKRDWDILVGTSQGVKLVNRMNLAFTSYNTSLMDVRSIIGHHNIIYLLREESRNGKVESCSPDLNNCQLLFQFNVVYVNRTHFYPPRMAVSSKYIVVSDHYEKLLIYDLISKGRKIKPTRKFYLPYFLPDGHLLATDLSSISKYRLEAGEPIKLWTCGGLEGINSVVADAEGYIYGLTYKMKNTVYIISPDGELLQTTYYDRLPDYPLQASIRGNEMAVPGWDDGKLHLFKINN